MASPTPSASSSPQRYAAMQAANQAGTAYTPGMANPATIANSITPPSSAFSSTTPQYNVASIYAPLQQNLDAQRALTNQRYAQNQADIKNIFGSLSTIRAQDAAKIADQFKASLTQQQGALASRTAEARTNMAAGAQGAQTAGAELGGGPVMAPTDSLSAQAANQGVANSNAVQTNWEGLQGAMQGQTQQNLQNAISGYGFQQAQAVQDLGRAFQEKMSGLDQSGAQLQSQIAQAEMAKQQAIASNNFEAAMKADELANALKVAAGNNQATLGAAQARAGGTVEAATIAANARKTAASIAASKASNKNVSSADIKNIIPVQAAASDAYNAAYAMLNPAGSTKITRPTAADVKAAWTSVARVSPQRSGKINSDVMKYINSTYNSK
jgi:hypothetical protein